MLAEKFVPSETHLSGRQPTGLNARLAPAPRLWSLVEVGEE